MKLLSNHDFTIKPTVTSETKISSDWEEKQSHFLQNTSKYKKLKLSTSILLNENETKN